MDTNIEVLNTWLLAQGFTQLANTQETPSAPERSDMVQIVFNERQNFEKTIKANSQHSTLKQTAYITSYVQDQTDEVTYLLIKTLKDNLVCGLYTKAWHKNDKIILKDLNHHYYETIKSCQK
ncbi:MAG TPA: hypothetical protein PKC41_08320 [Chitinophagaceae bacterium]|nr:hypothetical protein [Chitinophagaceae bacterium]